MNGVYAIMLHMEPYGRYIDRQVPEREVQFCSLNSKKKTGGGGRAKKGLP